MENAIEKKFPLREYRFVVNNKIKLMLNLLKLPLILKTFEIIELLKTLNNTFGPDNTYMCRLRFPKP